MSLFSSSNPDSSPSSHKNEHPSFSEAVLDSSSRTRDALPEQYRETFDELRSGILAFCKEFQIPVESLSSVETFETSLRSHHIPPKRMGEVVLFFQRLEYLIAHKEPIKENYAEALEYADKLFHLTEQYTAQVSLLERAGILKDGGITGIDGNHYPIPTLEEIAERLYSPERREMFEIKQDQKFIKLLLVPFGMSLNELIDTFRNFLLACKKNNQSFGRKYKDKWNISDVVEWDPLFVSLTVYMDADTGDAPKFVYFPKSFDEKNHGGKTKAEILSTSKQGWRVLLLQAPFDGDQGIRLIPRAGEGETQGKIIPRPDLEGLSFIDDYFSLLQEARDDPTSPYHGESGMTPEDWLLAFMTHLMETEQPLDNSQEGARSEVCLVGATIPSWHIIPLAYWDREFAHVSLEGSRIEDNHPFFKGSRFVVEV